LRSNSVSLSLWPNSWPQGLPCSLKVRSQHFILLSRTAPALFLTLLKDGSRYFLRTIVYSGRTVQRLSHYFTIIGEFYCRWFTLTSWANLPNSLLKFCFSLLGFGWLDARSVLAFSLPNSRTKHLTRGGLATLAPALASSPTDSRALNLRIFVLRTCAYFVAGFSPLYIGPLLWAGLIWRRAFLNSVSNCAVDTFLR
jgi:hypothetical protein